MYNRGNPMSERQKAPNPAEFKYVTIDIEWYHPQNGCKVITDSRLKAQRVIKKIFTATGHTKEEARCLANILAENSLEVCSLCGNNYERVGQS